MVLVTMLVDENCSLSDMIVVHSRQLPGASADTTDRIEQEHTN
jgi:hypothetical protein